MSQPPPPQFVRVPAAANSRLRLFVFPHSGSGAYPYRPMISALPPWVELSILQLPGRETMFGSPMFESMKQLIDALVPVILPQTTMPYAFFGHSLGAHVAFEAARALRKQNAPAPRALLVSGTRAPHLPFKRIHLHDLSKDRFLAEIRRYGGTPEAVLQNEELMDIFMPPLRADLKIFETYSHAPEAPFDFPMYAFTGRNDHRMDLEELDAWSEHTTGNCSVRVFEGGHFYLLEQAKPQFLAFLRETLETLV